MHGVSPQAAYQAAVLAAGLFPSLHNLSWHLRSLFDGVPLAGRRMLDVGGGDGIHSFHAACEGAREVVCLEPEDDGSTAGARERFRRIGEEIGCGQVHLEPVTLQAYAPAESGFDVVLMHDSINHLDDWACEHLRGEERARDAYRQIFAKLASLCAPGATLIVCDCARRNFFGDLGLRSPFVPTVSWRKHQAPQTWEALLRQSGFVRSSLRWSTPNAFGPAGRVLLGHALPAYFFKSHFRMTLLRA
jgi:hypothetical protein